MAGVVFKGQDLKELGFNTVNYDLSLIPIPKTYTESPVEFDGSYDFSEFNEDGRIHYEDRNIMVEVDVLGKNLFEIERIMAKLSRLIAGGYGELVVPTLPTTVWTAKIEAGDRVNRDLRTVGIATIPFRAKPFAKHKIQSDIGLRWEDCYFTWSEAGALSWDADTDTNIILMSNNTHYADVYNWGDIPSRPIITVTGEFTGILIRTDDINTYIKYQGAELANQTVILDFEKQIVTSNGVAVSGVTGDFWEWSTGLNHITLYGFGGGTPINNVNVNFHVPHHYLYEAKL